MSHLYRRNGASVWYVKFYQDGKPKYESLRTTNKKRAQAMQREIDRKLHARIVPLPEKPVDANINIFWTAYSGWTRDHKRPATVALEDMAWRQFIEYTAIECLSDITPAQIERFKKARLVSHHV